MAASPEAEKNPVVWIASTRDPDGEPVCEVTWGPLQWYATVLDVRETALDLMTCASYAEMMMTMITTGKLPPAIVEQFTHVLLRGREKRYFGAPTGLTLTPAGSSRRREALVLLKRGSMSGAVDPGEARKMALNWMKVAEGTESDQLFGEALRALRVDGKVQKQVFAYVLRLRDRKEPG